MAMPYVTRQRSLAGVFLREICTSFKKNNNFIVMRPMVVSAVVTSS